MTTKKSQIDLHTHSNKSDGKDDPITLVHKAKDLELILFSITDHDNIDSQKIAEQEAKKIGLNYVRGLELSVVYNHPVHTNGEDRNIEIVGYGIDYHNKELVAVLEECKKQLNLRADKIVNKVNELLLKENYQPISDKEYNELKQKNSTIGGYNIAQLLVEKGIVGNTTEASDKYLSQCHFPKKKIMFEKGSALIRSAGGKVVIAHPHGNKSYALSGVTEDLDEQKKVITSMRSYLDGLECFHWDHTKEESERYVQIAENLDLIITGGSDHHGGKKERIGKVYVPEYVKRYFVG